MKYSISGTASNGMPVNEVVDLPDEAAVRAYADSRGITLSRIRLLEDQSVNVPISNTPRHTATRSGRMRSVSSGLFTWAWALLIGGLITLFFPPLGLGLISLAFFLFPLGALYSVGSSIVAALEEK